MVASHRTLLFLAEGRHIFAIKKAPEGA